MVAHLGAAGGRSEGQPPGDRGGIEDDIVGQVGDRLGRDDGELRRGGHIDEPVLGNLALELRRGMVGHFERELLDILAAAPVVGEDDDIVNPGNRVRPHDAVAGDTVDHPLLDHHVGIGSLEQRERNHVAIGVVGLQGIDEFQIGTGIGRGST